MRLFDAYIAVDWSAASKPTSYQETHNAIWIGEEFTDGEGRSCSVREVYCQTRHLAERHIRSRLQVHLTAQRRVFLGFDFPYGYPAGFAKALDLAGNQSPWRQVWEEYTRLVKDDEKNDNNRFEVANLLNARCGGPTLGPFWGHLDKRHYSALRPTSPEYPYAVDSSLSLDSKRCVEKRARGTKSVWQLFGNGSVGGQCIVGIPVVSRLRDDLVLAPFSRVWPFETGFTTRPTPEKGPFILHGEIWPGVIKHDLSVAIRDQAQVRAVVRWLSELDEEGRLGILFDSPSSLSPDAVKMCLEEEGWIIGSQ